MDDLDNDDELNKLKKSMGITYQDNVVICPDKMPNYKEKVCVYFLIFVADVVVVVERERENKTNMNNYIERESSLFVPKYINY